MESEKQKFRHAQKENVRITCLIINKILYYLNLITGNPHTTIEAKFRGRKELARIGSVKCAS